MNINITFYTTFFFLAAAIALFGLIGFAMIALKKDGDKQYPNAYRFFLTCIVCGISVAVFIPLGFLLVGFAICFGG